MRLLLVAILFAAVLSILLIEGSDEKIIFGPNKETVAVLGTLVFSLWGATGLAHQAKKLREGMRGHSVSNKDWLLATAKRISSGVYGVDTGGSLILFNGALSGFFHFLILFWLWRRRGFNWREWLLFGGLLMILVYNLFALSYIREFLYLVFGCLAVVGATMQPREMIKEKCRGDVSFRLHIIYFMGSLFWAFYGASLENWPVFRLSIGFAVVRLATAILYFVYPAKPQLRMAFMGYCGTAAAGIEYPEPGSWEKFFRGIGGYVVRLLARYRRRLPKATSP